MRFRYNFFVGGTNKFSQFFHVYNKTIDGKRIFTLDDHVDAQIFLETVAYYRSSYVSLKLSECRNLDAQHAEFAEQYTRDINDIDSFDIDILAYCLMPTHYHLLLHDKNNSLKQVMSTVINSFTRYFNTKYERRGQLFISPFRAKHIRDESTLLHVSRYIHLNPYSSGICKTMNELQEYPYSSYSSYLGLEKGWFLSQELINQSFSNSISRHQEFVQDHADNQKTLEYIKQYHLAGG